MPTGRRLMRRSAPTSTKILSTATMDLNHSRKSNEGISSSQDPKQYLFSKMFQDCGNDKHDGNFSGFFKFLKIYLFFVLSFKLF